MLLYGFVWKKQKNILKPITTHIFTELGGQFMVVKLFKRFFCFKLLPLWTRFVAKMVKKYNSA